MKNITVLFAVLFSLASAALVRAQDHELRAQIEAAEKKWVELINKMDFDALTQLYTADAERFSPESGIVKGRAAIRKHFDTVAKLTGQTTETAVTLDVFGAGDLATETGRWTSERSDGSLTEEGNYVMLWKKVDGEWKVLRETWNTTGKKLKLKEELQPLERFLGTWLAEVDMNGTPLVVQISWQSSAGGSAITHEGSVRINGELVNEWSGLIFQRTESKTLVDVVVTKTEGHSVGTMHPFEEKVVSQISGFDHEGTPVTGVDEFVFRGKAMIFSQLTLFKGGSAADNLIKDVEMKRLD